MKKSRILLLGGKDRLVPAIHKAQGMGLYTIVADRNPAAPGLAAADLGLVCDISDISHVVELARTHGVQGVLSLSEFGVVSAACAAAALGLPGIGIEAAKNATNKWLMRSKWADANLPQPEFRLVKDDADASRALDAIGLPVICKPCSSSASRAVTRVRSMRQLRSAVTAAVNEDRDRMALVERCILGVELSCEAFIVDGELFLLALGDKDVEQYGSTCVTWSLTYPSVLTESHGQTIEDLLQAAAAVLGIRDGCCHAEIFVCNEELYLLEMAARGGGGHIYTTIVEHVSGVDYLRVSIERAMGWSPSLARKAQGAACYRFLKPPQGRLLRILGVGDAAAVPFVYEIGFVTKPGTIVVPVCNGAERPGWIVTLGPDRNTASTSANRAEAFIVFEMDETPMEVASNWPIQ